MSEEIMAHPISISRLARCACPSDAMLLQAALPTERAVLLLPPANVSKDLLRWIRGAIRRISRSGAGKLARSPLPATGSPTIAAQSPGEGIDRLLAQSLGRSAQRVKELDLRDANTGRANLSAVRRARGT